MSSPSGPSIPRSILGGLPIERQELGPGFIQPLSSQPPQQIHERNVAQGNARAHYGNNFYNAPVYLHGSPDTSTGQNSQHAPDLAENLAFDTMDDRFYDVEPSHAGTCQWLFERSEYKAWRDPTELPLHNGFFWMRGKPGSGKSTLMKFALEQSPNTQNVSISYFFNARGSDILPKSLEGMYRSLLYQIYDQIPELLPVLHAHTRFSQKTWSLGRLKQIFKETILELGSRELTCYIDALDECFEESGVRDMVDSFEALGAAAVRAGMKFYVMFSSRHYPHITIGKCQHLILDDKEGHQSDIDSYIRSHLRIGRSELALEIQRELQRKASGVFLWVVLVTRILNEEMDRGNIHQLRDRLNATPGDLYALFEDALQISSPREGKLLTLILQLVLFSHTKLSLQDLYFAAIHQVKQIRALELGTVTVENMAKFILDASKGLVETGNGSHSAQPNVPRLFVDATETILEVANRPTVQFIHESVRDYLLQGGLNKLIAGHSEGLLGTKTLAGICHDQLKECCHLYILMNSTVLLRLDRDEHDQKRSVDLAQRPSVFEITRTAHPFFAYALHGMLRHADRALSGGVSQDAYIDAFPTVLWCRLYNRFGNTTRIRYEDMASTLTIKIYIIVMEGTLRLADAMILKSSGLPTVWDQDMPNEEHPTLLSLAVASVDYDMVKLLLERGANVNSRSKNHRSCLYAIISGFASSSDSTEDVFVARMKVMTLLLDHGADVNAEDGEDDTALRVACRNGNVPIVMQLLTHKADTNSQGGQPLLAACQGGHATIVRLLLENGAKANPIGGPSDDALLAACNSGSYDIAKMLLEYGADVNVRHGRVGKTALHQACALLEYELVELLLEHGADASIKNIYGLSALDYVDDANPSFLVGNSLFPGRTNENRGHFGPVPESGRRIVSLLRARGTSGTIGKFVSIKLDSVVALTSNQGRQKQHPS